MTKAELIEQLEPYAPKYLHTMSKAQLTDELERVTRNLQEFGEPYPIPHTIFDKRDKDKLEALRATAQKQLAEEHNDAD